MKCKNCGVKTNNPKYCSVSCSAKRNNRIHKKRNRSKQCKSCNTLILSNRVYCKCCSENRRNKDRTLGELKNKNSKYPCAVNNLIRYHARQKCKNKQQKCEACGYEKHVEVCHIKPIRDFNDNNFESEINSPENLILLCPNCHWEQEHKCLDVSKLR